MLLRAIALPLHTPLHVRPQLLRPDLLLRALPCIIPKLESAPRMLSLTRTSASSSGLGRLPAAAAAKLAAAAWR